MRLFIPRAPVAHEDPRGPLVAVVEVGADEQRFAVARERDPPAVSSFACFAARRVRSSRLDPGVDPHRIGGVLRVDSEQNASTDERHRSPQSVASGIGCAQTTVGEPHGTASCEHDSSVCQLRMCVARSRQRDRERRLGAPGRGMLHSETLLEPERPVGIPLEKTRMSIRDAVLVGRRSDRHDRSERAARPDCRCLENHARRSGADRDASGPEAASQALRRVRCLQPAAHVTHRERTRLRSERGRDSALCGDRKCVPPAS